MKGTNAMTTDNTRTEPSPAPVFAEPLVAVEVVLPVVVGEQLLTLDEAVNRLGQIQDEERALKKEKDPLRKATEDTLRANGLDTYATVVGRSATCYEQERCNADKEYLRSILTPEQFERAFPPKTIKGLRIR